MIPTLILFGLAFGRWWRLTLIAGVVAWPAVLLATGTTGLEWALLGGTLLAALNTAAGILTHQAILIIVRRMQTRLSREGR